MAGHEHNTREKDKRLEAIALIHDIQIDAVFLGCTKRVTVHEPIR